MWTPPFDLELSSTEKEQISQWIPKELSNEALYSSEYHEGKIQHTLKQASFLEREEAWALSMYLGPIYYYQRMNLALYGDLSGEEQEKFLLLARAATIALVKNSPITSNILQNLPQPSNITYECLKRYRIAPPHHLYAYQNSSSLIEPSFISTTYWQSITKQIEKYSQTANLILHIYPNEQSQGRLVDKFKRSTIEGEVLFPPGVEFEIRSMRETSYTVKSEGNTKEVYLVEMYEL